jgi:hypothetical protein
VQIVDQVGPILMHVPVQAEFHTRLLKPREKRVGLNFLIARDRVMPDGNAQRPGVGARSSSRGALAGIFVRQQYRVRVWEASDHKYVRYFPANCEGIRSVAWSADGRFLASGSDDNTVQLWEVASGEPGPTLEGHTDWVRSARGAGPLSPAPAHSLEALRRG